MSVHQSDVADVFATHRGRVFRLARRYRPNPEDAEDLSQETWLRAVEYWNTYRGDHPDPWPWLARLLRTTMISAVRHQARIKRGDEVQWPEDFDPESNGSTPEECAVIFEEMGRLLDAIRMLSEPLRDIVLAVDLRGETPDEYAEAHELTSVAARQRCFVRGHHSGGRRVLKGSDVL